MNGTGGTKASLPGFESDGLEKLLNIIDRMRSQGVSSFVSLPQIIVVGDQSSGKSSCLEAICGAKFPTGDTLCTRFATEMSLRRSSTTSTIITIIPDIARSRAEKKQLACFKSPTTNLNKFPEINNAAAKAMGIDRNQKTFSNDILRIELSGPTQLNLTIVDLPGLFHSATAKSTDQDRQAVEALVKQYMQSPRSIVLAVVSAKNDLNNQIVCELARKIDPEGRRTLGIITKPDTLHIGSESEKEFYTLAENKDVSFALGWHVLKNRDYDTKDASNEERDRSEREFFGRGVWDSLPKSQTGVHSLKSRLSKVLTEHIAVSLPGLIADVESSIAECEKRLDRLGLPRASLQEQKVYLNDVAETFAHIVNNAVGGYYNDSFFGKATTDEGFSRRLRANVNERLRLYSERMTVGGQEYMICDNEDDKITAETKRKAAKQTWPPVPITKDAYLEEVRNLIKRTRGRELVGSYRPEIVSDLFKVQSGPWERLTRNATTIIFTAAQKMVLSALNICTDTVTRDTLLRQVIIPGMEKIKVNLGEKVKELLVQYQESHAMTYNHYFTDNVQQQRNDQKRDTTAKKLLKFFGYATTKDPQGVTIGNSMSYSLNSIINALMDDTETDMEIFACMEAHQTMEAYYKVACKQMVDDFAKYPIEACLMKPLTNIFTPKSIYQMSDNTISSIAAESEESKVERDSSSKKLEILLDALEALRDFGQSHSSSIDSFQTPMLESMVKTENMWGAGDGHTKRRRLD